MQEQSYSHESKLTFVPRAFIGLYRGFLCYLLIHNLSVFNVLIFISPANLTFTNLYVVVIQLLSHFQLFMTQASLSFTISWSLLRFISIESVMLSNHLIICLPLLFFPSIFPSIRVFSSESALHIRWPKY